MAKVSLNLIQNRDYKRAILIENRRILFLLLYSLFASLFFVLVNGWNLFHFMALLVTLLASGLIAVSFKILKMKNLTVFTDQDSLVIENVKNGKRKIYAKSEIHSYEAIDGMGFRILLKEYRPIQSRYLEIYAVDLESLNKEVSPFLKDLQKND